MQLLAIRPRSCAQRIYFVRGPEKALCVGGSIPSLATIILNSLEQNQGNTLTLFHPWFINKRSMVTFSH
jgi:hypothetical protein